jgi:hypothetical protein
MTLLTPQLNWLVVAGPLFQAQIGMLTSPKQLLSLIVAGEMTKFRTLNQLFLLVAGVKTNLKFVKTKLLQAGTQWTQ